MIGTIIGWVAWLVDLWIGIRLFFWFFTVGMPKAKVNFWFITEGRSKVDLDPISSILSVVWLQIISYLAIAVLFIINAGWNKLNILWLIPIAAFAPNAIGVVLFAFFRIRGDLLLNILLLPFTIILAIKNLVVRSLLYNDKTLRCICDAAKYKELYHEGALSFLLGEYDKALENLDKALKINPRSLEALREKAIVLNELKHYNELIEVYDSILKLKPSFVYLDEKANALCELGRCEEAIKIYENIIKINPNSFLAWYNKGLVLSRSAHYGAERALILAISDNVPSDAIDDFRFYGQAIRAFNRAIEIDPNNSDAWYMKGLMLQKINHHEEVLIDILRRGLGSFFIQKDTNHYEEVIEETLNTASKLTQSSDIMQHYTNRYKEARDAFKKATDLKPDNIYAWRELGRTYEKLGCYEQAIHAFDRAIEIKPKDEDLLSLKKDILAKIKRNAPT